MHKKLDRKVICQLINASIEDEAKAGSEYAEILEVIPTDDEYRECVESILEIMEDEANHAITLIKIGKKLGCKKPDLGKDEELLEIADHIHKVKIK